MSSNTRTMTVDMYIALYGPIVYAITARHPTRNEQILVVSVVLSQEDRATAPLTFIPHHSCGDHIDIQVYRIRPEACEARPPLRPGDILPLSDGTFIGGICHNLDDQRTEDPTIRVSIKLESLSDLSVCVVETPELRECYYLPSDIPGG